MVWGGTVTQCKERDSARLIHVPVGECQWDTVHRVKTPWARTRAKRTTPTAVPPQVEKLRRRLRKSEEQLQKTRAQRDRLRARLDRDREELEVLRAFTLDVFPGVEVPDRVAEVVEAVRRERLSFLSEDLLRSLVVCVREIEQTGREGLIIEAGAARGGSAIVMAAAKAPEREMRVYDVFGMIPPPGEADGEDVHERYATIVSGKAGAPDGELYYGYREDLLGEVTESFARHGVAVDESNVRLVEGLFADTITGDEPVALAHLDGDWYESTMTCLERIAPRLVPGGRIVLDDYFHWSGCRTAVDEYFADRPGFRLEMRARVHVVREADA